MISNTSIPVMFRDIKALSNVKKKSVVSSWRIKTKANDLEYFHPDHKDLKMFF